MIHKLVLTTIFLGVFIFTACKNEAKKGESDTKTETGATTKDTQEDTTKAGTVPEAEVYFSSETVRPGNMAITSSNRMFVTMNPLLSPKSKIYEIKANGEATPYPNDEYVTGDNSVIKAVIGIRADSNDNLWLLDMGAKQFVVWDTKKNELVKKLKLPEDVVLKTSFLQDFVIDEKHKRLIIADMTQGELKSAPTPAFIVVNMEDGSAKRMAQGHKSMMPEQEGGFALNPIAISPDFEWVYYGALSGRTIYRTPASAFDSDEKIIAGIEKFGKKSFCDGIAVDKNQNVYITNIEEQAISVSNKDGLKNIATLPKSQSWPDGLYIGNDGHVYSTVDQLNRIPAMNKGKDDSKPPFLVIKTPLVK